jgi:hypothetical protein
MVSSSAHSFSTAAGLLQNITDVHLQYVFAVGHKWTGNVTSKKWHHLPLCITLSCNNFTAYSAHLFGLCRRNQRLKKTTAVYVNHENYYNFLYIIQTRLDVKVGGAVLSSLLIT